MMRMKKSKERKRRYLLYNNNSNRNTAQCSNTSSKFNIFYLVASASISSARVEISKFSGGVVGEVVA